jgi:hypothetical protein
MNDHRTTDIAEGLPPEPPIEVAPAEPDIRLREPTARDVFLAWEKLRLLYNALLTLLVFALMGESVFDFLPNLLEVAILANLIFCAGPVAEHYLSRLTMPRLLARLLVFFLACTLAVVATVRTADRISNHLPVFPGFPGN